MTISAMVKRLGDKLFDVKNLSGYGRNRLRLKFKNGYSISILQGVDSYGNQEDRYEIAPLDKTDNLNGYVLFDNNNYSDDVIGYLSQEDVERYANEIANLDVDFDIVLKERLRLAKD